MLFDVTNKKNSLDGNVGGTVRSRIIVRSVTQLM